MARDLIVPSDDLDDLTLTQARLQAALDDPPVLPPGPSRIIIVVDATSSMGEALRIRKVTPEKARAIVQPLFATAVSLQVQVVYFRGADEFQALGWFSNAEEVAQAITSIGHQPGWTQHHRAFQHILKEAREQPVHSVIVITDAVELKPKGDRGDPDGLWRGPGDVWDDLGKDMLRLRRAGCRVEFIYKGSATGGCPFNRAHPDVEKQLVKLAEDNEGGVVLFNPADPKFTDHLHKVATEAALRAKGHPGSAPLLPDLRAIPFSLEAVGEEVLVAKCAGGNDSDQTG